MAISGSVEFIEFANEQNPLNLLSETDQKKYIFAYLKGLNVKSLVIEPMYFDKDYLDEFSSFYSRSSQCYSNVCKRLHFFSDVDVTCEDVFEASSGDQIKLNKIQDLYLGFIVLRPIPVAPFGRTVLAFYPDRNKSEPRITSPSRTYVSHLCGISLTIEGLAWQQQDSGVAACATISLWTMFHSSAFDEHHSIPTTAAITKSAKKFGAKPFPSVALSMEQILEAIHQQSLNPIAVLGDLKSVNKPGYGNPFSKARFANNIAAFVRSGYPLLVVGHYENNGCHAFCIVGFRDKETELGAPGSWVIADKDISFLYVHDDNFGPNIRFELREGPDGGALLVNSPPDYVGETHPSHQLKFFPYLIISAVHEDVKISADDLYKKGLNIVQELVPYINNIYQANQTTPPAFTFSTRFILLWKYFDEELSKVLSGSALAKVRFFLQQEVPPMSLHLGVVRIGAGSNSLLMDILVDTTDSGRNIPSFACVVYDQFLYNTLKRIDPDLIANKLRLPNYIVPAF